MPKKTKPKKAPAQRKPKFGKLRDLFAPPGVSLTIKEIAGKLGTKTHSACAAISVLGNPAHMGDDVLRISLDRQTGKYSVAPTHVAGADAVTEAPAKKTAKKKARPKAGGANGPRTAVA